MTTVEILKGKVAAREIRVVDISSKTKVSTESIYRFFKGGRIHPLFEKELDAFAAALSKSEQSAQAS